MGNTISSCSSSDVAEQSTTTIDAFDGALDPRFHAATGVEFRPPGAIRPSSLSAVTATNNGVVNPREGDMAGRSGGCDQHHPSDRAAADDDRPGGVPRAIPRLLESARSTQPPPTMNPDFDGFISILSEEEGTAAVANPLQQASPDDVGNAVNREAAQRHAQHATPSLPSPLSSCATAGPPSLAATTAPMDPRTLSHLATTSS